MTFQKYYQYHYHYCIIICIFHRNQRRKFGNFGLSVYYLVQLNAKYRQKSYLRAPLRRKHWNQLNSCNTQIRGWKIFHDINSRVHCPIKMPEDILWHLIIWKYICPNSKYTFSRFLSALFVTFCSSGSEDEKLGAWGKWEIAALIKTSTL